MSSPSPKPTPPIHLDPLKAMLISSALCKIMKYILKNWLDWWLEHNSILSDDLYAFRRGKDTLECLANFSSKIYQSFSNRHFLSAAFIGIRGAFDSVHVPLISPQFTPTTLCI